MPLVILCLLLLLPISATQSCGYSLLGEDYRVALFNPYLVGPDYQAFFFSTDYLNNYQNAQMGSDRRRNCEAWAAALGDRVRWTDVWEILYGGTLQDWQSAAADPLEHRWKDQRAWQAIRNKASHLDYVLWAKSYEVPSENGPTTTSWKQLTRYWSPKNEGNQASDSEIARLLALAETNMAKAGTGTFIERRYAYQLLLMARYRDDKEAFYRYFNTYFKNGTDVLSDWARYHEINFLRKDSPAQYVAVAQSFVRCPEKAVALYTFYHDLVKPADHLIPQEALADVYAFAAVCNFGYAQGQVQMVAQKQPNHSLLPLLIAREINKLENWLLTNKTTYLDVLVPSQPAPEWDYDISWEKYTAVRSGLYKQNYQKDLAYLKQFRNFVSKLKASSQSEGLQLPSLQLMNAHLAMLDNDVAAAFKLTEGRQYSTSIATNQAAIIRYVALLSTKDLSDATTQQEINQLLCSIQPSLQTLQGARNTFPALLRFTAQAFEAQRDTATAYFFHLHSLDLPYTDAYSSAYYERIDYLDRPLSTAVFDKILSLIETESTSEFTNYLKSTTLPSSNALRDVAGTVCLRANQLPQALRYFEAIPMSWYQKAYAFSDHLNQDPLLNRFQQPKQPAALVNKPALVQQLIQLEQTTKSGSKQAAAQAHLALGEAWFNMSHYGKAWMLLSYGRSSQWVKSHQNWPYGNQIYHPHSAADYQLLFGAERAVKHWQKALALGEEADLVAQSEFALLDINYQKKYHELESDYSRSDERTAYHLKRNEQLKAYANRYQQTAFLQTALMQCSTLEAAVGN